MNKNPDNIGTREKFMKLPNENIWRYSTKFLFNEQSE